MKDLFQEEHHHPVDEHAGKIDLNAVRTKILRDDEISLADEINQTYRIGERCLLEQIDRRVAEVRQRNDRRLPSIT